jgi:hypothetical protein
MANEQTNTKGPNLKCLTLKFDDAKKCLEKITKN